MADETVKKEQLNVDTNTWEGMFNTFMIWVANKDGLQICFSRLARIEKCYTIDKESKVTKTKITTKRAFFERNLS